MLTNANYIYIVHMDLTPEFQGDFGQMYQTEHQAHLLKTPGAVGGALFEIEDSSMAVTRYASVYELEDPKVMTTPEWKEQATKGKWPKEILPFTTRRNRFLYRRIPLTE